MIKTREKRNPLFALNQLHFLRTPCLGNGGAHGRLGLPIRVNNQNNPYPPMHAQRSPHLENSSLRFFFLVTIGCMTLTVKTNQHSSNVHFFNVYVCTIHGKAREQPQVGHIIYHRCFIFFLIYKRFLLETRW